MDIATVSDFKWDDVLSRNSFLMMNGILHRVIDTAMSSQTSPLDYPILDIADSPVGHQDWIQNHYLMHQQADSLLALNALPDLQDVDFEDSEDFYNWLQSHAQHHALLSLALGLN